MLWDHSLLLPNVFLGDTGQASPALNVALRNAAQAREVFAFAPLRALAGCHCGKIALKADFALVTPMLVFSCYDCMPPGLCQIRDGISIPVAATPGSRRRLLPHWVR